MIVSVELGVVVKALSSWMSYETKKTIIKKHGFNGQYGESRKTALCSENPCIVMP